MKQHITKDQWNELNAGEMSNFIHSSSNKHKTPYWNERHEEWWELPSIGQMIEFLGDVFLDRDKKDEYCLTWWRGENLCNELWEAVKYKMEADDLRDMQNASAKDTLKNLVK